jgi:predicted GNAT family acetyltransferase
VKKITMKLQLANNILPSRVERRSVFQAVPDLTRLRPLTEANRQEVLSFLKVRPVHTVVMAGWIADNGFENELNRGKFYGYRDTSGQLEGVALIGHTTLIEARSEDALTAFAIAAKMSETSIHVIMSDGDCAESFWRHFARANQKPRLVCTELLFELNFPFLVQECSWNIRSAKVDELEQIAEAHAEVALIESGVDPLKKDREGFLKRTLRRIEKERTFVVFDNGKLVFKADIAAETDDVIYLEGIYVASEYRGKGIGSGCLSKLSRQLLSRGQNICLLSNVEFEYAHRSFLKAGYKNTDSCKTIFV